MGLAGSSLGSSSGASFGTMDAVGVGTGGKLLGSLINWGATALENRKARKYNKEMAQWAYNKDVEMWNMQNEYNSPENQMKRFEEAGLNPKLIYGQGTPGNAVSYPKMSVPEGRFGHPNFEFPDVLSMYNDTRLKNAQVGMLNKTMEKANEEIKLKQLEVIIKGLDAGLKPRQIEHAIKLMDYKETRMPIDLQNADLRNKKISEDINLIKERLRLTKSEADYLEKKLKFWNETGMIYEKMPWYIQAVQGWLDDIEGNKPDSIRYKKPPGWTIPNPTYNPE